MRELYSDASQILGYDLLKLCLEGPKSLLDETKYCQVMVWKQQCFGTVSGLRGLALQGLKNRSKMLNQHKIILLFTALYLSIDIFC